VGLAGDGVFVPMAQPDGVVVEVVGRGDLDAAGAEGGVGVFVSNDGDAAAGEGQFDQFADEVLVARVLRVHRHGAVPEQGLRAGGGDHHIASAVGEGVAHVPHVPGLFLGQHLQVRDGGVQHRVPVDQALAAIDEAFLEQTHEDLAHRRRQAFVHGEALVLPVQGGAHAPQLAGDGAAGLFLPLPDALDEGVTAQVVAGLALLFQEALDDHLGGDAGMIRARLPEGGLAAHAVIADQGIHDGVLEGVAHVQAAGDVRRRDHDAVRVVAGGGGGKVTPFLPNPVPSLFQGLGVVVLVEHD
jgi:hypothetical protein